ncbi:probable LRR receptor-like serine/threonine-protein kinase At1g67720 isoform X2 [Hordeum vulgare subsp. vulgare]|uniref:probable LRR receptor-like serine/threonine-protein kinase At1g67720 isoform X2 n=1 Tax=Hordeum vulgare subsp. vulgare TaxID=112509 RepID=UPI000B4751F9|nr:probable LRR receptor-like serine/threonine-protein kinase At1g67720 isoform X2 [Hordeum vulgare subsp. vulgare]
MEMEQSSRPASTPPTQHRSSCSAYLRLAVLYAFFFLCSSLNAVSRAQMPTATATAAGFLSIDCGGSGNYTDARGLRWTSDAGIIATGTPVSTPSSSSSPIQKEDTQYTTLRAFPADGAKHCYALPVATRARYLVRATFLYAGFDGDDAFPEFDLYLGATRWSPIVVYDGARLVTREAVVLAQSSTVSVCLSNATTGRPFISTLELRPLNGSLYRTDGEASAFLALAARINFGAPSPDPLRYPDDPYDRIWESDMVRRANYLVDAAPGTVNVSTDKPVFVATSERPPEKVMQTAVVGTLGELTYRLNLNGFPGDGWAFSYFAEIEESIVPETRKFKLFIPGLPDVSKATVDVGENAPGKLRLYQPGYYNVSLPFVLSFAFKKTNDSSRGPILNAFEIYKYVEIEPGSPDELAMASLASRYTSFGDWANEGGDPCWPSPWSWVRCSSQPQLRVVSINLSGKNLTGNVPPELVALTFLAEIRLDDNMLTGPIPDLAASSNLSIIHFENNQLTGSVPSYLSSLPKLTELYVQNNKLSGYIPKALKSRGIIFNYAGNMDLKAGSQEKHHIIIIISALLGVSLLLAVSLCCYVLTRKTNKKNQPPEDDLTKAAPPAHKLQKSNAPSCEIATETCHPFRLCDLEEATKNFENRIGSGGFGIVYYGKLPDGREIAVKVPTNDSYQGKKQFTNEVSLLSRIHHRNLVAFLGYCHEDGRNILVYEFMMNGTLKEHLHGRDKHISWIQRLEIAEDSAKGIEYLHSGCTPSIIHRDIKTSNILLDKQMRAKVSDFGLSKLVAEESHASTNVRGTLGYLDPQYYISQQLTEKSDVYSFGIILLELISGRPPISAMTFGDHFRNIGPWAKFYYESGDIEAVVDPAISGEYRDVHSVWKVAETAVRCIDADARRRPCMAEVVKEVQEAIALERPPSEASERRASFPFSPAGARSGTVRSHDMIMDNLMREEEESSSFPNTLRHPELR